MFFMLMEIKVYGYCDVFKTFDADSSELLNDTIKSVLCEIAKRYLNSSEFKIGLSLASKTGESNFIGIIYRATFKKEHKTENVESPVHNLIVKVAPPDLKYRDTWFSRPCFLREIHMYNEVLPTLRQFEESEGVYGSGFSSYPTCYQTIDKSLYECLMLEDLGGSGFSMIDQKYEEITADHVKLVMQSLAKFHAISFALNEQHPVRFEELTSVLKKPVISRDTTSQRELLKNRSSYLINAVSDDEDAHLLAAVRKLLEREAADIAIDCLDLEKIGSATVISHGDAWQNNFMFRYNSNGRPIEVNLLDWQLSFCSSPVNDISFFLFCSLTKNLRDTHYNEFLKFYHENLSTHIQNLGSDPEKLFPYELMLDHLRKFSRHALIVASILLPLLLTGGHEKDFHGTTEQIEETQMTEKNGEECKQQIKLKERLRDIISDMVHLGYI